MHVHFENERDVYNTNAMVLALDNTGILMFVYYPQLKKALIPERTMNIYKCRSVYENMPHGFVEEYVYEGDYTAVYEMYRRVDCGEVTASSVFHSKDLSYCAKVTLTTVNWTEDEKPETVIGIIEDRSEAYNNEKLVNQLKERLGNYNIDDEFEDALKTIATSISEQYYAVYYIWLESQTYICFQEQLKGILAVIGEKGLFQPAWDKYIEGYIEEEDQDGIREFIEISTLADRIGHKTSITHVYRRKEVGWTRGQFIVGKRDENGKPLTLIYTVSDINEEMETKLQKQEAEQEALRDPLTKLWNRKAFEQFKETKEYKNNQVGILLFDIDRFKVINDQYGHEVGDQVIITIANEITAVLRRRDLVFRMGGDEFAVLLYNCNPSVWNTICRKIEVLHFNIKDVLPHELNVTLSAGLCVNTDGYRDEMYKLADRAMYNTKANGRGGCSFISLDGRITDEWYDQNGLLRKGDVLEKNSTVTWVFEWSKKDPSQVRAYGDNLFRSLFGIDSNATPDETYKKWVQGVSNESLEIMKEAAKAAVTDGKSEIIYYWNHPERGMIQIRNVSSLDYETDDYYVMVGYLHVLTGVKVFTLESTGNKIKNALEEMYFCNFYIKLEDFSFEVHKAQPYMMEMLESSRNAIDVIDSYIKHMVAEESRNSMTSFLDLMTLKQRMKNTNFIGTNYNDSNAGWLKAKFAVVDRDTRGEVETVSLVVEVME